MKEGPPIPVEKRPQGPPIGKPQEPPPIRIPEVQKKHIKRDNKK